MGYQTERQRGGYMKLSIRPCLKEGVGKTFLFVFRFLDMQGTEGRKRRVFSVPFCNSFVTDEWKERGGIGVID